MDANITFMMERLFVSVSYIMPSKRKRLNKPVVSVCVWEEDSDGNWETACGNIFCLNEGTPSENEMRFCCYCGKQLSQKLFLVRRSISQ